MAALCRRSESRSVPTLAAELVRKYATAGVRTLAMHHAARLPAPLCRPKTTVHAAPLVVESQPAAVREGARTTADGGKQAILAPAWEPVSGCSTSPLVRNHDAGNELQGGRPEAHLRFKFVCFVFKMQANGETRHSSQREMSLILSAGALPWPRGAHTASLLFRFPMQPRGRCAADPELGVHLVIRPRGWTSGKNVVSFADDLRPAVSNHRRPATIFSATGPR